MTREQMINHLVLHGWQPYKMGRNNGADVVDNGKYTCYYSHACGRMEIAAVGHVPSSWLTICEWRKIGTESLRSAITLIEERTHAQP